MNIRKFGRPAIGGSTDNQQRFPVRFPKPLVDALDTAATAGGTTRTELVRTFAEVLLPQYRTNTLSQTGRILLGQRCPLCTGYVDGPHRTGCGYFGPMAERDIGAEHDRLPELAARFDRHGDHPALAVAAAVARLKHVDSGTPEDTAVREELADAMARLHAQIERL